MLSIGRVFYRVFFHDFQTRISIEKHLLQAKDVLKTKTYLPPLCCWLAQQKALSGEVLCVAVYSTVYYFEVLQQESL